jgi:hypothetical protein
MSGAVSPEAGLQEASRSALGRLRLEAVVWGLDRLLWILPAVLMAGLALAWMIRPAGLLLAAFLFAILTACGAALVVLWARPRGQGKLPRKMDRFAGLPDLALAAAELADENSPWTRLQKSQAVKALENKDWKRLWPVALPRWFWPRLLALLVLAAACFLPGWFQAEEERALADAEAARRTSPELREDLLAVEEMFEEWEKAGTERQDEWQSKLMKEVQPLRERLAKGEMTERQLLIELSKVEETLRAMQESLKSDSVQQFADPLAKTFEPHEGMGALAAALRREAFEQSKEEAERLAEKFEQNQMRMDPERTKELAEELEKLAEEARKMAEQQKQQQGQQGRPQTGQQSQQQMRAGAAPGQQQAPAAGTQQGGQQAQQGQPSGQQLGTGNQQALAQALQQMASGLRNGNGQQSGAGMRQMAASMGREGGRQMQDGMMGGQMAQLGGGRQGMAQGHGFGQGAGQMPGAGQGQDEGQGMGQGPSASEQMARQGGGAGTAPDEQPFGPATEMGSHKSKVDVAGQAGEGNSQVQIQRTQEPTFENVASGLEGVRFQQYQKLSQEAVGNEALPVSHRQSIRKYFERIRPKTAPESTPTPSSQETTTP